MKFNILKDKECGCVSLCLGCDDDLDAFLDVYIEDEHSPSPFKDIDDATAFVEIIKKLLEKIT